MLLSARLSRRIPSRSIRYLQARQPCRRHGSSSSDEMPTWFRELRERMLNRKVPDLHEKFEHAHNRNLGKTLLPFLPGDTSSFALFRALGSHLTYFNHSNIHTNKLLPDGTDAIHSPGEPFIRRLWAGGMIKIDPEKWFAKGRNCWGHYGAQFKCVETISDVQLRGSGDNERILVEIERKIYERPAKASKSIATEHRHLVFFRGRSMEEMEQFRAGHFMPVKYLPSRQESEFSHSLTPNSALLFRFSALTFNAHSIHLDRDYTRNVEGHRDLLVHGPLSLTILLIHTHRYLESLPGKKYIAQSIEYRHLAPLYCNEPMQIRGRSKPDQSTENDRTYEVWIEGPTGGIAVTATIRATHLPPPPDRSPNPSSPFDPRAARSRYESQMNRLLSSRLPRSSRLNPAQTRAYLNPANRPADSLTRAEKRLIRARALGIPPIRTTLSKSSIPPPPLPPINELEPTLSPLQQELAERYAQRYGYGPRAPRGPREPREQRVVRRYVTVRDHGVPGVGEGGGGEAGERSRFEEFGVRRMVGAARVRRVRKSMEEEKWRKERLGRRYYEEGQDACVA